MFFNASGYNYDRFDRLRLLKDMGVGHFAGAPEPGDRAPDFKGITLTGRTVRLKDYRGKKNVVLTFGSATCPQTAASLPGLNELHNTRHDDTEFLFVYVREAHPGERLGAHTSLDKKCRAAERLRDEEAVEIPIIVDSLEGSIHRKYGKAPNPTFIIDRSGRVVFRSLASRPHSIAHALDELADFQHAGEQRHAVVYGGEDLSLPSPKLLFNATRALQRGGRSAVRNFRKQMGVPGRFLLSGSRAMQIVVQNPGKFIAGAMAVAGVLGAGVWAGVALRRKRLGTYRDPYSRRRFLSRHVGDFGEYEAVGI